MRIDFLSYVDPWSGCGGGELTTRALLEEGRQRGHEIRTSTVLPEPRLASHGHAELSILADVWNVPGHWRRPDRQVSTKLGRGALASYFQQVRKAMASGRYIHHDNAYVDICARPYLPCGADRDCKRSRGGVPCRALRRASDPVYRNGRANSFVSPLHADVIETFLGPPLPPRLIMRPIVDVERFNVTSPARDIPYLYVGPWCSAKGADRVVARHRDHGLHLVASEVPTSVKARPDTQGVVWLTPRDHEDMPALFARAQSLCFHPRWPEPQGRVVVEAAIAGCSLEVSGRIGALSFSLPPHDPALSIGAAAEWWEKVEELAEAA